MGTALLLSDIMRNLRGPDDPWSAELESLKSALSAYADQFGVDLTNAQVRLVDRYRVQDVDPGYNFTPDASVAQYRQRWVDSGRLHGEDLTCQVSWYSQLVDAAAAGVLPPSLLHETETCTRVVDGGHRLSAHRSAGHTTIPAYVISDLADAV